MKIQTTEAFNIGSVRIENPIITIGAWSEVRCQTEQSEIQRSFSCSVNYCQEVNEEIQVPLEVEEGEDPQFETQIVVKLVSLFNETLTYDLYDNEVKIDFNYVYELISLKFNGEVLN